MVDKNRILVVEDDLNVGQTLIERLNKEGYDTTLARSVEQALIELEGSKPFELALLDVGLRDGKGFDVAKSVRKAHPSTALIFLTAYATPDDRVKGLELGAEDYVAKPFHLKELLLRVRNALKRARAVQQMPVQATVGRALVRFDRYEIEVDGHCHSLSQKECALLRVLVERRGQVVSRDDILNEVWADEQFPTSRTVDNFVMKLRRWVEIDAENPSVIRSVRGVGYQLI